MSILSLKNKYVCYHRTDETPFLTSKAEATQNLIDINYSLEESAHNCTSHQHKGKVALRKAVQFGIDSKKDQVTQRQNMA